MCRVDSRDTSSEESSEIRGVTDTSVAWILSHSGTGERTFFLLPSSKSKGKGLIRRRRSFVRTVRERERTKRRTYTQQGARAETVLYHRTFGGRKKVLSDWGENRSTSSQERKKGKQEVVRGRLDSTALHGLPLSLHATPRIECLDGCCWLERVRCSLWKRTFSLDFFPVSKGREFRRRCIVVSGVHVVSALRIHKRVQTWEKNSNDNSQEH